MFKYYYYNVTKIKLFYEVLKFVGQILYISAQYNALQQRNNEKE